MRLNELHNVKITESESSNELLKRQLDDAREFFRKGMKWDLASRNAIVSICRSLSVSGFLATNVVFDPSTTSKTEHFAAQIDHVLVTDSFVLIIENKRWKGLVFADKHPSAVSPPTSSTWLMNPTSKITSPCKSCQTATRELS